MSVEQEAEKNYLERELHRYYLPGTQIEVDNTTEEEVINVRVTFPEGDIHRLWFQAGSDDDWYTFRSEEPFYILTVPLIF